MVIKLCFGSLAKLPSKYQITRKKVQMIGKGHAGVRSFYDHVQVMVIVILRSLLSCAHN